MTKNALFVLFAAPLVLVACEGGDADLTQFDLGLPPAGGVEATSVHVPTLDDVAAMTRVELTDGEAFVLEGDMLTDYDGLVRYYEARYLATREKSTGVLLNGPGGTQVFDKRTNINLRYCLTGGWDTATSASKATVVASLEQAAANWQRVVNVRWHYSSALDGAACVLARVTDGSVDFRVTQHPTANTADAAFAGYTAANQLVRLGRNATSAALVTHELGHTIGLAHEQFHSLSGLGCTTATYTFPSGAFIDEADLTGAYDSTSIMHYFSGGGVAGCSGGTPATGTISLTDGLGARVLYGAPASWTLAYGTLVLD